MVSQWQQDQYAAYGGLNFIEFHNDGNVEVNPINCDSNLKKKLENSIIIFFTGRTRNASEILANQIQEIKHGGKRKHISRMVELSYEMKKELEGGSLKTLGLYFMRIGG